MKNSNSNPWMRSKALYVIPVAALALSAFATPKFVAPIQEAVTKLEGKSTEISAIMQTSEEEKGKVTVKEISGKAYASVDEALEADHKEAQPLIVINDKIFEIPKNAKLTKRIDSEEQFSTLINIKPENIESITVIQEDAAKAKWGDKGVNGAIVITTKDKNVIVKDLVKKLPGAEVDEDGTIKIRGRNISKIKIDDKVVFNRTDSI